MKTVNRFKKLSYSYDLISGKVNMVSYQPPLPDQANPNITYPNADAFYHRYNYDAENRLTGVETSRDNILWTRDAKYNYYRHGPLARTELGDLHVQGVDYAYTIRGELKGINSTSVGDGSFDMGGDGKTGGVNALVARDAFGISLNYFAGDYNPINVSVTPFTNVTVANDLFNGNIKTQAVNIPKLGSPLVYAYGYDQLNRLVSMDAYNGLDNATNIFTPVGIPDYKERLAYDPNGNIQSYLRNGTGSTLTLNNYRYNYTPNTNQLASIDKKDANGNVTANKTYNYDAIGNTTKDDMQGMTNAVWNLYGKLQTATNKDGLAISYTYGADGQRIGKTVGTVEEYYVKDATGNTMATYKKDAAINGGHLSTVEFYRYGNSLLGTRDDIVDMVTPATNGVTTYTSGNDNYILADGNGNTKVTISGARQQHSSDGSTVDWYGAIVKTATFHSTFGANANTFNGGFASANFNGQRKSTEIGIDAQTAEFWEYDAATGHRKNRDPVVHPSLSPYATFGGNPILYSDPNGADTTLRAADGKNLTLPTGASGITAFDGSKRNLQNSLSTVQPAAGTLNSFNINGKQFDAHFGGQSGEFLGYYSADLSYNDYAAQEAANGNKTMSAGLGLSAIAIGLGEGGAGSITVTGSGLPAIPLVGGYVGWNYGATHADKVTNWVVKTANFFSRVLGVEEATDAIGVAVALSQSVTLYRGVSNGHPDYPNALLGMATPWGLNGGHSSPAKHNEGNNLSIFTSWTTSRLVAQMWATSNGPGGLILSKQFSVAECVPSPDIFREGEVLIPGIVTGATVTKPGQ